MLDVWLIPAMVVLVLAIGTFYVVVRSLGGKGVRTDGRTVVDKPGDESDPPP